MKTERAEAMAIVDIVKRIAMVRAEVGFTLEVEGRAVLRLAPDTPDRRLGAILGADFRENAVPLDMLRGEAHLTGFAGLPTFNRGGRDHQHLFVNRRPVKDKMLLGAVRGAYQDLLARDRHPVLALFIDLPAEEVDVNVHPAKTEVRFRDSAGMRGLIVGGLKHALASAGHRASTSVAEQALAYARPEQRDFAQQWTLNEGARAQGDFVMPSARVESGPRSDFFPMEASAPAPNGNVSAQPEFPLGAARGQLHETYIVAQTADGIVIVDQHAAHERLTYERIKGMLANGGVKRQALLIPQVVNLDAAEAELLLARMAEFAELGLVIEPFGGGAVLVRESRLYSGRSIARRCCAIWPMISANSARRMH